MRYFFDFGSGNAGASPSFLVFADLTTLAPLTPPPILEVGSGQYCFDVNFPLASASDTTAIVYKAACNAVDVSGVIVQAGVAAPQREVLDFGLGATAAPVILSYRDVSTFAPVTPPVPVAIGYGLYYFDYTFPSGTASISYVAAADTVELAGVLSVPVASDGGVPVVLPTISEHYDTAGEIINDAAVEVGLAAVPDPFTSSDPNHQQLVRLLKQLGREVCYLSEWNQLQREHTFQTVAGQIDYPLPADFSKLLGQTGWNRTTRLPLGGPASPQEWQLYQARAIGASLTLQFRARDAVVSVYPSPPDGIAVAFEYLSRQWVKSLHAAGPDKDVPTAASDFVLFDPLLMVRGLKLGWLQAKGFDTTAALADFRRVLGIVQGASNPGPVLRLHRRRMDTALAFGLGTSGPGAGTTLADFGGGGLGTVLGFPV